MLKRILAATMLLTAATCTPAPAFAEPAVVGKVKSEVADMLRDPESARFRQIVVLKRQDKTMCAFGVVQGRNGFGGYGNGLEFNLDTRDGMVMLANKNSNDTDELDRALKIINRNIACIKEASGAVYGAECDKDAPKGKCLNLEGGKGT